MAALVQGVRGALVISTCVLRRTLTKSAVVGLSQKCLHTNSIVNTKPCKVVSIVLHRPLGYEITVFMFLLVNKSLFIVYKAIKEAGEST